MKIVLRFFPEMIIKSREVRQRHIGVLRRSLRTQLALIDPRMRLSGGWDGLTIETGDAEPALLERMLRLLTHTPGIDAVLEVQQYPLEDIAALAERVSLHYAPLLAGKRFAARCKRVGQHAFSSMAVERAIGAAILAKVPSARVDLERPEVLVRVAIRDDEVMLVERSHAGLGGYPLGTQDAVLSLISGGFDSTVASFLCIKRGLLTHYCFFRLGGAEHEFAVKEVALFLWLKYGASHRVKFVTVPFEEVVEEIVAKVENSQMGVVLKRMMLRAASHVAERLKVETLLTGESVSQVASQTLANLAVIDRATDKLILRPLALMNKREIIDIARAIGTEALVQNVPEYCGVISVRPSTRAGLQKVVAEEAEVADTVVQAALARAEYQMIDRVMEGVAKHVPLVPPPQAETAVIIDIRHPSEEEQNPLRISDASRPVLKIPFYELRTRFAALPPSQSYLLYCEKGFMSRLHATHLQERGHGNVGVYQ